MVKDIADKSVHGLLSVVWGERTALSMPEQGLCQHKSINTSLIFSSFNFETHSTQMIAQDIRMHRENGQKAHLQCMGQTNVSQTMQQHHTKISNYELKHYYAPPDG